MKGSAFLGIVVALILPFTLPAGEDEKSPSENQKKLFRAIQAGSNDEVQACLEKMIREGGKENIQIILRLLPKIPPSEDAIYWNLLRGACSFRDREALEYLGNSILRLRSSSYARDLIYGMARNRSKSVVYALAPILEKGDVDLQIMAAEKIGTILSPIAVDVLIETMKREEKKSESELRDVVLDGLRTITGQDFKYSVVNWEGWWKKNRDKPLLGSNAPSSGRLTGTVVDHLKGKRAKGFLGLEKASRKAVIVLSAIFPERDVNNDKMENVLDDMRIPYTVVNRPDFENYDLRGVGAILINCAQFHEFCICPDCKPGGGKKNRLYRCTGCDKHIKFSARLSGKAIKKLQNFVRRGGFLFCEDWTVKEVIERAFPKFVTAGEVLREGTVDVVPARGRASHPFLRGIFRPDEPEGDEFDGDEFGEDEFGEDEFGGDEPDGDESDEGQLGGGKKKPGPTVTTDPEEELDEEPELVKVKHQWIIDDESWAFRVRNSSNVVVLMTSGKLQKEADGQSSVALCFWPYGGAAPAEGSSRRRPRGMVMLVLSHFGHQETTDDEYTLQNLLLNFLLEANVARTVEEVPEKRTKEGEKGS